MCRKSRSSHLGRCSRSFIADCAGMATGFLARTKLEQTKLRQNYAILQIYNEANTEGYLWLCRCDKSD